MAIAPESKTQKRPRFQALIGISSRITCMDPREVMKWLKGAELRAPRSMPLLADLILELPRRPFSRTGASIKSCRVET